MIPPLPAAVAAYAAPQQRFEQLRLRTLMRRAPHVCDLAYANASDGPGPEVMDEILAMLSVWQAEAAEHASAPEAES